MEYGLEIGDRITEKTMLKRGDEIVCTVDAAAFEGKSVARLNGFVVFVEGAAPGDVVKARIVRVKKNYAEARVVSIERPSSLRVEPRCAHFGICGGCTWQHIDYEAQLSFKRQHVVDAFERIGGFKNVDVLPVIGSEAIYFYRNKMEFSFSDREWIVSPEPGAIGGLPQDRNTGEHQHPPSGPRPDVFLGLHVPQRYDKVLDIGACHLQSDLSNQILDVVRHFARRNGLPVYSSSSHAGYLRFLVIREGKRTQEVMVNLVTFDDRPDVMKQFSRELLRSVPGVTTVVNTINTRRAQIAYGETEKVYFGDGVIHERLGRYLFTISASSFFQTNTAQAERLYEIACSFAELKPDVVVWDLYSGTGAIALFVSDGVREVVGIESVESAVRDAGRNATANGVANCRFVLGDLKDCLVRDRSWMSSRPDVMLIDPPRSGMHPKVVEEIVQLAPPRIVYVSCNPATQARDVKMLCQGGYDLRRVQPVDMFPHTSHVENVALLVSTAG